MCAIYYCFLVAMTFWVIYLLGKPLKLSKKCFNILARLCEQKDKLGYMRSKLL